MNTDDSARPTAGDQATTCCGEGGAWSRKGEPLLPGCALCPNSSSYWRTNRRDGPSQPATLEQSYAPALDRTPHSL